MIFYIPFPIDLKQENPESNGGGKEGHEDNGSSAFKETHCFGNGTSNVGGSTGSGENGNSGGSRSPYTQGGSNLIPVYAAGSAKNRKKKTPWRCELQPAVSYCSFFLSLSCTFVVSNSEYETTLKLFIYMCIKNNRTSLLFPCYQLSAL